MSQMGPAADSMFEAALRALDTPIIIHGQRQILFANAAAGRALRAPDAEALIGAEISAFVHPDGVHAGNERRKLVLEYGQAIHDLPVKLRAYDGTTLYARVDGKRIEWANDVAILLNATSVSTE